MSDSLHPQTAARQAPLSMEFPSQEHWSGSHSLLQKIFLTPGSIPCLLHFRQILYHLSHYASPQDYRLKKKKLIYTVLTRCYSVTQSCPNLCKPMHYSTPGFPVLHYLPEFAQTYVHQVGDAIQPSHPLLTRA